VQRQSTERRTSGFNGRLRRVVHSVADRNANLVTNRIGDADPITDANGHPVANPDVIAVAVADCYADADTDRYANLNAVVVANRDRNAYAFGHLLAQCLPDD
jgi:hypothetical protein